MTTADTGTFIPTRGQADVMTLFASFMSVPVEDRQVFTLCGFAGTGKTTLVRHLVNELISEHGHGAVRTIAPTGKAASVLRRRGMDAMTVHKLLYVPTTTYDRETHVASLTWELRDLQLELDGVHLLVVDEASMVDVELTRDLLDTGKKILAIGDPFQLPPVRSGEAGERLLLDHRTAPDAMLTEVTRQAHDSPVLHLATVIRENRELLRGRYGDSVVLATGDAGGLTFTGESPFIVGRNRTRHAWNHSVRRIIGRQGWEPEPGDRLLCRRNDRRTGLINGEVFIACHVHPVAPSAERVTITIKSELDSSLDDVNLASTMEQDVHAWTHLFRGEEGERELGRKPFGARRQCQELTYGYAITCHASQGSEWPAVVVIDESKVFGADRWRWLYTAITRASERVAVIS